MILRAQPSVGAVDWRHAAWLENFYPHTLPADWQLAFYANEFLTVLVPRERWLDRDAAECAQWLAEVGSNFRLFLDCPLDSEHTLQRLQRTFAQPQWPAHALGGLLVRSDNADFVQALLTNNASLGCQLIVGYSGEELTFRDSRDHPPNWLWLPQQRQALSEGHGISVGLIEQAQCRDDRSLRALIESFMARGGAAAQEAYLFIAGDPPSTETLRRANIIGQLL